MADKWALLIINVLDERTLRLTELRNEVDGICDWTLAYLARIEEARRHFDGAVQPGGPPAH